MHKAQIAAVGSVGSIITASTAIDIPEVRAWAELAAEKTPEEAFDTMFNGDKEVAKAFSIGFDQLQQEHRNGIVGLWSANDLSRFVMKTREVFPSALGCIALVPDENNAQHAVLAYELDVSMLLK